MFCRGLSEKTTVFWVLISDNNVFSFAEAAPASKPLSTPNKEANQEVTPDSKAIPTQQRRKIHLENLKSFQPKTSLFFQANIGVGFLYFRESMETLGPFMKTIVRVICRYRHLPRGTLL